MQRVTMQDIADAAGVSKISVSRALRGDAKCGPQLREKILQLAKKMGYQPDPLQSVHMARLRKGKSTADAGSVIGFLDLQPKGFGVLSHPSNKRYLAGAKARARELGLKIEVFQPRGEGMTLARINRILQTRGIRGLVIGPLPGAHQRLEFDFTGIAAVTISQSLEQPRLHRVGHNHYKATWQAMEFLHRMGRRRVAMAIEPALQERVGQRWHAAYHEFNRTHPEMQPVASFGFDPHESDVDSLSRHAAEARAWVAAQQPDAILCLSTWLQEAVRKAGRRVPEDVILFDMDTWPGKPDAPAHGINQCFEEIGAVAVEEILGQWVRYEYGVPARPREILLDGEIR